MAEATLPIKEAGPSLRRYLELDGIRGVAALVVFFHHVCNVSMYPCLGWNTMISVLYKVSEYGFYGVDLFFVLSGFLITSLLIQDRTSRFYYKDFYWKRALRIGPIYLLTLALVAYLVPFSHPYILLSMAFLANFAGPLHILAPGPFWSLSIEEQFYLLWPTVVRRSPVKRLLNWAIGLWVLTVVLRLVFAYFRHYNFMLTPLRADGLAAGAVLACWNQRRTKQIATISATTSRELWLMLGGCVVAPLLYVAGILCGEQSLRSMAFGAGLKQDGVVLFFAVVIAAVIRQSGSGALAWLRSKPLRFFGDISYAFYMLHIYVILAYDIHIGRPAPGDTRAYVIRVFVIALVTVTACLFTRYVIELPTVRLRRFVLSRPTPLPESALPLSETSTKG